MVANVAFTIAAQDNSKYLVNENVRLKRELVVKKKQVEHIATENQWLSSLNFYTTEWHSMMLEELEPLKDTLEWPYDEMILI